MLFAGKADAGLWSSVQCIEKAVSNVGRAQSAGNPVRLRSLKLSVAVKEKKDYARSSKLMMRDGVTQRTVFAYASTPYIFSSQGLHYLTYLALVLLR